MDLFKEMEYLQNHNLVIGILGDGGNVSGMTGGSENELTVLAYGNWLEFGTSKMQPFAFFRHAIESNENEIQQKVEDIINDILAEHITGKQGLMQLGEYIRGLIVESIATAGSWARPLTPKYEKWKNKNYPNRAGQTLIKDGFLIKSIRYKIKKGSNVVYTSDWANV